MLIVVKLWNFRYNDKKECLELINSEEGCWVEGI